MSIAVTLVGVAVVVLAGLTIYKTVRVVEEGSIEALLVFGEMQAVLRPGLNFVPPFVSKTYPIDSRTMTMDTGDDQVSIPTEFEEDVREASNR